MSMLSVQLFVEGDNLGALNLYSSRPYAFEEEDDHHRRRGCRRAGPGGRVPADEGARPITALRRLHNGLVNDYAAFAAAGLVVSSFVLLT